MQHRGGGSSDSRAATADSHCETQGSRNEVNLDGKNVFQCFWPDPKTRIFECFWVSLCILDGKNVFQCFWSDPKTRVFECFWVSLCILDMVKLFFSVFGQTQKHVFLSVFLRF